MDFRRHTQLTDVQAGIAQIVFPASNAQYATKFEALQPGDDVFLVEYPNSLGIASPYINPMEPLLKKAIIAGKNPGLQKLIIDGPAYFGNSGGPVWKATRSGIDGINFSVSGVVTAFIPFEEEWVSPKYGLTNKNWSVSGYCVAEPIDPVIELLNEVGHK